jgi:hypothetical protein
LKVEENGNWMDGSKNMNNESEGTEKKYKMWNRTNLKI